MFLLAELGTHYMSAEREHDILPNPKFSWEYQLWCLDISSPQDCKDWSENSQATGAEILGARKRPKEDSNNLDDSQ